MNKLNVCVMGAGGFIGGHLAKRLHDQGHHVRGVDLKHNKFIDLSEIEFIIADLRDPSQVKAVIDYNIDELYLLAASMGGAGFIFTGDNDSEIFSSSELININVAKEAVKKRVKKLFYSSSACALSQDYQKDPVNNPLTEDMAYPANPDSLYGWQKLMGEQLLNAYARNHGLNIRIARFHNIMGPQSSFYDGKEKAPAAVTRKVIMAQNGESIDIWGSGKQVRSFLDIQDCLDGVQMLMDSDYKLPVNIGSEESISINDLAKMAIDISGKDLTINNIEGPTGVAGRSSDNTRVKIMIGWEPQTSLRESMERLYKWMKEYISLMPMNYEVNPETKKTKKYITEVDLEGNVQRYYLQN